MATAHTKKKEITPLKLPNGEQTEAINFGSGYACVVAGPGSGKSFVLVQRFARLISEGISPDDILSLSFTRTAAKNLRDRVESLVGKLTTTRTAGAVTFHSLALSFAQEQKDDFGFELAEFPLADEPVANRLSAEASRRFEVDPRNLRSVVSVWKRKRLRPATLIKEFECKLDAKGLKLALAYKQYDKLCREKGLLDFDSLMFEMVDILSRKPAILDKWQYLYVMADEAQDNCLNDWELLKLLSRKHGNLVCVGDPGQSVYGFRGASPSLFLNMEDMFPDTKKLFLATNYRSTPQLVDFLKEIGPVKELAEKFHTPNPSGPEPEIHGFLSPGAEAAWVTAKIKESLDGK